MLAMDLVSWIVSKLKPYILTHDFLRCQVCSDLWAAFSNSEPTAWSLLVQEALASDCNKHKELVKLLIQWSRQEVGDALPLQSLSLTKGPDGIVKCLGSRSDSNYGGFRLVLEDSVSDHPGSGKIVDNDWIDLVQIRHWMAVCVQTHGACHDPVQVAFERPAWMIDTTNRCIVAGYECKSYIALSYVWGAAARVMYEGDMFDTMKTPGALDSPDLWPRLPPIMQHVISLTPLLGERYVWIDALCIDHRDPAQTSAELRLMGLIYMCAEVTVVLEDGDAQDGLPGIPGVSCPRKHEQISIPWGSQRLVSTLDARHAQDNQKGRSDGIYYTRGWTYQEFRLSRRRLIFSKERGQVRWLCHCDSWSEDFNKPSNALKGTSGDVNDDVSSELDVRRDIPDTFSSHNAWLDFPTTQHRLPTSDSLRHIMSGPLHLPDLSRELNSFNARDFTFEEDAYPGVIGGFTIFNRARPEGVLYGLPLMYLEAALGWEADGHLRRRKHSGRNFPISLGSADLPSWSWVGWQGKFRMADREFSGTVSARDLDSAITTPITTWYARETPEETPGTPIESSWFRWRDRMQNEMKRLSPEEALPEGWTRESPQGPLRSIWFPEGAPKQIFRHVDKPWQTWYWPQHFERTTWLSICWMPAQKPFLACATKRATFQHVLGQSSSSDNLSMDLLDTNGVVVGSIVTHLAESTEDDGYELPEISGEITVVAIAKVTRYRNVATEQHEPLVSVEQQLSVLWVNFRDGIAYRLGSGWVEENAWTAARPEDVDLVLG